jgi:hypothetical protein
LLSVSGDAADDSIVISRDAVGRILVNDGAVAVIGGTPTACEYEPDPGLRSGRQRRDHA